MSDRREAWFLLGRLLPPEIRRRVFEPAYHDLVAHACRAGRSPGGLFGLRVALLTLDCARVGVASLATRHRRMTRTGRVAVSLLVFTVALGIVTGIAANEYLPPPPG